MSDCSVFACMSGIMNLYNSLIEYDILKPYFIDDTCLFINAISKVNNMKIVLYNSRIN